MNYGDLPVEIGRIEAEVVEMMFYHDMPIKLPGDTVPILERRLRPFSGIVGRACCDYIGHRGLDAFKAAHVYICAKRLHQAPGKPFNRPGWHTDGFGSDDINYVWSDGVPTLFNCTEFDLPADDEKSMVEMARQAQPANNRTYPTGMLLRLTPYVVHRVGDILEAGIRSFCKVTFSADRYDLAGNAVNHELQYDWPRRARGLSRNTPQAL
jgi:hypothetical protein